MCRFFFLHPACCFNTWLAAAWCGHTCFISGRDKKTPSAMSRSSSGFESSHLPSPEFPVLPVLPLPLTSTSPSKITQHSKPTCVPSPAPPKNSLRLPSPARDHIPINRSHSCMELRRNTATSHQLRRCSSLTVRHRQQKRKILHPKHWDLTPDTKSKHVTVPSVQSSDKVVPKQAENAQVTHVKLPPTVLTPSSPNPHPELPPTCRLSCTDHISAEDKKSRSISATSEARRLKTKRNLGSRTGRQTTNVT